MSGKGRVLKAIVTLSGKIDPSLGKAMQDVEKKLDGVNVKAIAVGAAIGTAIGVGVTKGTKYLAELGDSYNMAMNDIQAQTGATAAEMEMFGDVMQDIYKNNYGESFADVADGVSAISKNTKLVGEDLKDVTKDAFALRDTFGYEIPETARAAKALMTNFGISGQDAMNLIAAGAQNGLDYSGELIDSVNEYSVQFAKLGFTAEDMFKIYQQGADSGAWNLDKMGDAIKEFSIRSIDGSNTSQAAYEALGYDADEMFEIFTRGGDEASGAFHEVINRLMSMDDKVARDAAGVGLFGTMWEDLGTEAMQALADMEAGAYATGKELEGIQNIKYDNLGAAFETIKRNLEVGLLPVASDLANTLVDSAPKIAAAMENITPIISGVADAVFPVIGTVIELAGDGIAFLTENIDILAPVVAGLTAALGSYKIASILSAAATGTATGAITLSSVATGAWTTVSGIATAATTALGAAFTFLTSPIGLIILAIGAVVAIGVLLYRNWDVVKEKAAQLGEYLSGVWQSIKTKVSEFIGKIKETFKTGFEALVGIVTKPFDTILGLVDKVKNGVGKLWEKITGAKKETASIEVPAYAAGGFTNGISIAGEAGTEAIISFDPAYRSQNLSYWAKAGQMLGADTAGYSLGSSDGSGTVVDLGGVTFAPNITVQGNADKNDIIQAIREEYPEFMDMLEEFLSGRGDFVYV